MMRLLFGGSPCTHLEHSADQARNEPSGYRLELFRNYLVALEKFRRSCSCRE